MHLPLCVPSYRILTLDTTLFCPIGCVTGDRGFDWSHRYGIEQFRSQVALIRSIIEMLVTAAQRGMSDCSSVRKINDVETAHHWTDSRIYGRCAWQNKGRDAHWKWSRRCIQSHNVQQRVMEVRCRINCNTEASMIPLSAMATIRNLKLPLNSACSCSHTSRDCWTVGSRRAHGSAFFHHCGDQIALYESTLKTHWRSERRRASKRAQCEYILSLDGAIPMSH